MSQGRRLLALGVVASLALVACGSTTSTSSPAAATASPATPAAAASAAPSAEGSAAASAVPAAAKKMIPKLTIINESGAAWNCQFNPLNASDTGFTNGFLYEPLYYMNPLQSNPDGSPKSTPNELICVPGWM